MPAGPPRARHAGHALPRRRRRGGSGHARATPGHAAAHAHLVDADPLHGARTSRRCGSSRPGRVYRRDNLDLTHTPMFSAGRRARRRRGHHAGGPEGHALAFVREMFGQRPRGALPPQLLPLHRAERRGGHRACWQCERRGLPDVQADRLDRDPRLRHGASGRVRGRRLRPRALHRLRVRHRHRARRAAEATASRTSACSTRTTCASWSSSRL